MLTSTPPLLSELLCGSFLIYPSASTDRSLAARQARGIIWRLKQGGVLPTGETLIEYAARRLREELPGSRLEGFFDGAALVPVPTSKKTLPTKHSPQLWPADLICDALLKNRLGAKKLVCVVRRETIRSSSSSSPADRPSPMRHLETMDIEPSYLEDCPRPIIMVDDVVTRGSTMLAAASWVKHAYSDSEVKGFAVAATGPSVPHGGILRVGLYRIEVGEGGRCGRSRLD
jgi:predicted amidophosphoribosyltransferase